MTTMIARLRHVRFATWAVLAAFTSLALSPSRLLNGIEPLTLALGLLVIVLVAALVLGHRGRDIVVPWVIVPAISIMALSLLWSVDRSATARSVVEVIVVAGLAVVIGSLAPLDAPIAGFAALAVVVAAASAGWGLLDPTSGLTQTEYQNGSLTGVYFGRNDLGHVVAVALPAAFTVPLWFRFSWIARSIVVVGLIAVIVATRSSTAILCAAFVVVAALLLVLLRAVSPRGRRIVLVSVSGLLLVAVVGYLLDPHWFFVLLDRSPNFTGRTAIWESSLYVASDRWAIGYGWGAVWTGSPPGLVIHELAPTMEGNHPHSGYLELLLSTGVIGLVLFLVPVLVIGVLGVVDAVRRDTPFVVAWAPLTIAVTLLYDTVETFMVTPHGLFLLVLSLVVVLRTRRDRGPRCLVAGVPLRVAVSDSREASAA